jgi:uncharacterized phage-associated protein
VIAYFATSTRQCGKVKLFKLLYLLDFTHFRETGRSVTGLNYHAWKMDPVPLVLLQEREELGPDMSLAIDITAERLSTSNKLAVPKTSFDDSLFTRRELRLMPDLSKQFLDELTKPLIGFTHQHRGPRDKIWDGGKGNNERIPYALAVPDSDPHRDAILQSAREYEVIAAAAPSNGMRPSTAVQKPDASSVASSLRKRRVCPDQ